MKNSHGLVIVGILLVISTFIVYKVKNNTQQNMKIVQNIEEQIEKEIKEIQLLKVELSHLSQPDRINKLKDSLIPEMESIKKEQIIEWNQ